MKSHPLRMRGLKLFVALLLLVARESHPLRMRGLKHFCTNKKSHPQYVASFADAWIETSRSGSVLEAVKSHPLRMRGLKPWPLSLVALAASRILCGCVD